MNENELHEIKQRIQFPNSATANYLYYRKHPVDEWMLANKDKLLETFSIDKV